MNAESPKNRGNGYGLKEKPIERAFAFCNRGRIFSRLHKGRQAGSSTIVKNKTASQNTRKLRGEKTAARSQLWGEQETLIFVGRWTRAMEKGRLVSFSRLTPV